jgi:AmiR/NasT family two-component response regulator
MSRSGRNRDAGASAKPSRLRVLVANEQPGRLEVVAGIAEHLGQVVVARETNPDAVADRAREVLPDIAVVGLHEHHTAHALAMIEEIVGEGVCPVVAVIEGSDPEFVSRAAQSGIFAYISSLDADSLRGAFDVALRRFGHAEELEGALARRAVIERAKGILMERYGIDERTAFGRLRDQSQRTGEKLVAVCRALLTSHELLRDAPGEASEPATPPPA